MREQKLQEQRLHQEERLKRALERAQADPKRTVSNEEEMQYRKFINRIKLIDLHVA